MAEFTIYGASDDLLEIEGDFSEEFNPPDGGSSLVAVSDGHVLRVVYDQDGVWRITRLATGSAMYAHIPAPVDDDAEYSDRVTLVGDDLRWVVVSHVEDNEQDLFLKPKAGVTS